MAGRSGRVAGGSGSPRGEQVQRVPEDGGLCGWADQHFTVDLDGASHGLLVEPLGVPVRYPAQPSEPMGSENVAPATGGRPGNGSENKATRGRRPTPLAEPNTSVLAEHGIHLSRADMTAQARRTYLSRVRMLSSKTPPDR